MERLGKDNEGQARAHDSDSQVGIVLIGSRHDMSLDVHSSCFSKDLLQSVSVLCRVGNGEWRTGGTNGVLGRGGKATSVAPRSPSIIVSEGTRGGCPQVRPVVSPCYLGL